MNRIVSFVLGILLFATLPLTANGCVFCKPEIIEKVSVYECQFFNVLLSHEPRVPGHLLVIPKRHVSKAHELSGDEWAELADIIPKITDIFSKSLETNDYIILQKNGRNALQQVPHVHFHLLPVHTETWSDIFDGPPNKLNQEAL